VVTFSRDGNSLYVGLESGEVSLLDITDKTSIARQVPPIIAGSVSSDSFFVNALELSEDGLYLAATFAQYSGTNSVNLASLAQRQSVQKIIDHGPYSLAFAPSGLALAIGEMNLGAILYCTP
jgi:WD40 repeat protein